MKIPKSKAPSAFTLVELLAVIVIIGILTALLLPVLSRVKQKAQGNRCLNNVRQLGLILNQFVDDNHVYPLDGNGDFLLNGGYSEHGFSWIDALSKQFNHILTTNQNDFEKNIQKTIWSCPSAIRPATTSTNSLFFYYYGYNSFGLATNADDNPLGLGGHHGLKPQWDRKILRTIYAPPIGENDVSIPSEMIGIGDGFVGNNSSIGDGEPALWRTKAIGSFGNTVRTYSRHQGKANVVFCDGHVESPTLQFLFADTSDEALSRWNRDHLPHREKLSP